MLSYYSCDFAKLFIFVIFEFHRNLNWIDLCFMPMDPTFAENQTFDMQWLIVLKH